MIRPYAGSRRRERASPGVALKRASTGVAQAEMPLEGESADDRWEDDSPLENPEE